MPSAVLCTCLLICILLPLWSSGESSWLRTQKSRVRFPGLTVFLKSSGSRARSTQNLEDNLGATWMKRSIDYFLGNRDCWTWGLVALTSHHHSIHKCWHQNSPTSGGRSLGIIRFRIKIHLVVFLRKLKNNVYKHISSSNFWFKFWFQFWHSERKCIKSNNGIFNQTQLNSHDVM
jgi:hypothetical protein